MAELCWSPMPPNMLPNLCLIHLAHRIGGAIAWYPMSGSFGKAEKVDCMIDFVIDSMKVNGSANVWHPDALKPNQHQAGSNGSKAMAKVTLIIAKTVETATADVTTSSSFW